MNDICCPHCKKAFKVGETGFADIFKQVCDRVLDKEIHERPELAKKDKEMAELRAENNRKHAEKLAKKKSWDVLISSNTSLQQSNPILYSLLKKLQPMGFSGNELTLGCENEGVLIFMQKKVDAIEKEVSSMMGQTIQIRLVHHATYAAAKPEILETLMRP